MNLGLMLPTYLERTERLTLAETADDLGIDAVFTGESASSNVFIDLTWLASHTPDVGLGVGIVNVFTRTPTLIAMSAAELDAISGGRLLLGFGSSTKPLIEGLHGMSFERPISRISEYVDLVRAGLTGERLDFDGAYYSPSGGRIREMPVQESVPIGIAALGPVNRRLTGRKADVWLPHLVPRSALAELSGDIDRAARESGRDAGAVDTYAYVPTAIAADLEQARDRIRSHVAAYAGAAAPYRDTIARAGYEEIAQSVHEAWQADDRGVATGAVPDELVDDVGIAATPETARDTVVRWEAAGADMVVLNFPPGTDREEIQMALDAVT